MFTGVQVGRCHFSLFIYVFIELHTINIRIYFGEIKGMYAMSLHTEITTLTPPLNGSNQHLLACNHHEKTNFGNSTAIN